jgi:AraC-like DNA-binding protein
LATSRCTEIDTIRKSQHATCQHHSGHWGSLRAELVKRTGMTRQETKIAHACHTLLLNMKGEARTGEDYVNGRRVPFSPRSVGSLVFMPANVEWAGWDEGDATGCYLAVTIEPSFVEGVFGSRFGLETTWLMPAIGFRDSTIEMALHRIALETLQPDPVSGAVVESQAILLLSQLARFQGTPYILKKGGLSPFDMKQVDEMIDASSLRPMRIADMARAIGISHFHFDRAFKQTTGKTPRDYIAQRKIDRSLDLLRTTNHSLTEIALECGFSSSSHFSVAFKRAFGVGPAQFRQTWRV